MLDRRACSLAIALLGCGGLVAQEGGTRTMTEGFDATCARAARSGRPMLIQFASGVTAREALQVAGSGARRSAAPEEAIVFELGQDPERVREAFALDVDDPGPRFAVLLPGGNLFEMSFGGEERDPDLRGAEALIGGSESRRASALRRRFRELSRDADRDPDRRAAARAALSLADRETFCALLAQARKRVVLAELLAELAERRPSHARLRLAYASQETRGAVRDVVRRALAGIPEPISMAELATGPLAEPFPPTRFVDGVERPLLGREGRLTVFLFFVHHDKHLASHVSRWNRFARRFAGRPVDVFALAATGDPDVELDATGRLGFGFPVLHYRYEEGAPSYGIRRFPQAVILAGDRVAWSGDAYHEYEREVTALLSRARL